MGQVSDNGATSDSFSVTNGTKQGCVLAPLLFSIYFSMMLIVAFQDCEIGIPVQFRTDGNIFNLRRLQAKTKVHTTVIRDLLFADDCALMAHTQQDAQQLIDRFATAAHRFGLSVNLKKTEVLHQSCPISNSSNASITCSQVPLKTVDKFCYLARNASLDSEISARLAKASTAFGRLQQRLWKEHGIRLETKVAVYKAVVLSSLLYGCETWTLYRRQIAKLDQFHLRCLRKIAHIRWQDRVPNTEVLSKCRITGIEAMLIQSQLRWSGHVARMPDHRIPKMVFFGQLADGQRHQGAPLKRYKDSLKSHLKLCGFKPETFTSSSQNRSSWRHDCKEGIIEFEEARIAAQVEKRYHRKQAVHTTATSTNQQNVCNRCSRICGSRIGLYSHQRRCITHT